ncbi:hypothetical protein JCM10213v2_004456 [Rhodosporidiobolus nylandii]
MAAALVLSDEQRRTLAAIADAAYGAHDDETVEEVRAMLPEGAPEWQKERLAFFCKTRFSDLPGAVDALADQFSTVLSKTNLDSISLTLKLLSTRAGTLILTGYATSFADLSAEQREAVLQSWRVSRLALLRQAFRAFVSVTLFVAYNLYDDVILATGYPAGGDEKRFADPDRLRSHHPFQFERIEQPYQVFETDTLVVGSGAGGGVVAAELASKGWKVLVVEKGEYVKPDDMAGTQREGFRRLYESGGLMATEDGGLNLLAGSTFGGGTTVNWSASLRPQNFLREQWAKQHDLPHFLSPDFADSVETVCKRMGVSDEHSEHNAANRILVDGCLKLGYPVSKIPQNTAGHAHPCGFCGFGCPFTEKQGGTVVWLREAAENGAKFLTETTVERLLFASSPSASSPTVDTLHRYAPSARRKHCIGALVRDRDGKVAIYITGLYDTPIKPWEGAIMTAVTTVQENWDGTHHGVKIEVMMSFPGGKSATCTSWTSSKEHKMVMAQYANSCTLIAIARDKEGGRIVLDATGHPRTEYSLSSYDSQSLTRGAIACAEIHLISGARRICTTQVDVEDYVPQDGHAYLADERWKEWVRKVEKAGIQQGRCALASAHQMGSCQMGAKPSSSVVDPRGRVWGTEGLYVADAVSLNMALSHSISRFIDEDARAAAAQPAKAHL